MCLTCYTHLPMTKKRFMQLRLSSPLTFLMNLFKRFNHIFSLHLIEAEPAIPAQSLQYKVSSAALQTMVAMAVNYLENNRQKTSMCFVLIDKMLSSVFES